MKENKLVLVRGAGDLATGVIRRLFLAGFRVVATEIPEPLVVRRVVSFAEAVYSGKIEVEGVRAVLSDFDNFKKHMDSGVIPVVVDPEGAIRRIAKFDALVDARMMKKPNDTTITDASVVIGLGPGFTVGENCHAVIETLGGEDMGRAIYKGSAIPNTCRPTYLDLQTSGCSREAEGQVFFAERDGVFESPLEIGAIVKAGGVLGSVGGVEIRSKLNGILRGLLRGGILVKKGTKIIEVDASGNAARVKRTSAKANAVGGGAVEAVFTLMRSSEKCSARK
jgi:xanthine dehydrogenase accessory factor